MGRIKGHYEWDDDDLAPGRKKEGGLHQNLFDSDGHLRGSARFIPDDADDAEPLIVTETVFIPVEERRSSREDEELRQAITDLLVQLIGVGIAKGRPVAERWWREAARPVIDAKWAALHERRARRRARKNTADAGGLVAESPQEMEEAPMADRSSMSSAEAQARYLAALAARAYSDEQMRLVCTSNIVDGEGPAELQHLLRRLPAVQLRGLLEGMVKNPGLLSEESLANLASILGERATSPSHVADRQTR